jgi:hypothetical protein
VICLDSIQTPGASPLKGDSPTVRLIPSPRAAQLQASLPVGVVSSYTTERAASSSRRTKYTSSGGCHRGLRLAEFLFVEFSKSVCLTGKNVVAGSHPLQKHPASKMMFFCELSLFFECFKKRTAGFGRASGKLEPETTDPGHLENAKRNSANLRLVAPRPWVKPPRKCRCTCGSFYKQASFGRNCPPCQDAIHSHPREEATTCLGSPRPA